MRTTNIITISIIFFFLCTISLCAQESGETEDGRLRWKIIYKPKYIVNQNQQEDKNLKISNLIKQCWQVYDLKNNIKKKSAQVKVGDDKIEIIYNKRENLIVSFLDLTASDIHVKEYEFVNKMNIFNPYIIEIDGIAEFTFAPYNLLLAKELSNYLYDIKFRINEQFFSQQLMAFEPIVVAYNALSEKPVITEEQRKYIVQANGLSEQKMFKKAIELYKKAVEINPVSYPAAYSNMALLSAQSSEFQSAIYFMKKYLMLVPHAEDARSAQDKIYLWETQL
jgi:tetratricopeptide (TPR) repeat protein